MAPVNAPARRAYRYNGSVSTLRLTTGLCNWPYILHLSCDVCVHVAVCVCVGVCLRKHLGDGNKAFETSRERQGRRKEGERESGGSRCCENTHQISLCRGQRGTISSPFNERSNWGQALLISFQALWQYFFPLIACRASAAP